MLGNLRLIARSFANITIAAERHHVHPIIRSICSLNQLPLGSPTLPISIKLPTTISKKITDEPNPCIPLRIPRPTISLPLADPLVDNDNEIQAARLIVIRRKKMKKHKLRKLRKRMKYVWAKVRQKREMRKEKAFQAELMGQVKEAEKFSPANYVQEKLNIVNMTILPNRWRGKRLPEFVIKDLIAKAQAKKQAKIETLERRKRFMASYKPE
ncbi:uncharacterized protein LOC100164847 [Acyrthosiphon pisum]|uniref:Small ribosomal subunit protein mS38 n=1 Tax=Acyrthosiphon pisum TaxID=7029 RepID=C4WT88_ACYPI|nr:uncharacterized protein LOC100164847 [Acyrthosiphon pisum]BAH71108.1 ACYPI005832 [Acyrthosiphon pisum]|eukprot:NP_001156199.1 uncharacterized protein LOC100164847 [Acyrthosiphon pisum]